MSAMPKSTNNAVATAGPRRAGGATRRPTASRPGPRPAGSRGCSAGPTLARRRRSARRGSTSSPSQDRSSHWYAAANADSSAATREEAKSACGSASGCPTAPAGRSARHRRRRRCGRPRSPPRPGTSWPSRGLGDRHAGQGQARFGATQRHAAPPATGARGGELSCGHRGLRHGTSARDRRAPAAARAG